MAWLTNNMGISGFVSLYLCKMGKTYSEALALSQNFPDHKRKALRLFLDREGRRLQGEKYFADFNFRKTCLLPCLSRNREILSVYTLSLEWSPSKNDLSMELPCSLCSLQVWIFFNLTLNSQNPYILG